MWQYRYDGFGGGYSRLKSLPGTVFPLRITFMTSLPVQWATKVMTPTSVYFLWKQGSWFLWPFVRPSSLNIQRKREWSWKLPNLNEIFDRVFLLSFSGLVVRCRRFYLVGLFRTRYLLFDASPLPRIHSMYSRHLNQSSRPTEHSATASVVLAIVSAVENSASPAFR